MAKLAVSTPSAANSMSPALSPTPSHYEPLTTDSPSARNSPSPPSDNEEITYEEAKKRQEERALAALQCSIDNKEGEWDWWIASPCPNHALTNAPPRGRCSLCHVLWMSWTPHCRQLYHSISSSGPFLCYTLRAPL